MAVIEAFKGIQYSKDRVDISKVVAPPYDVITPEDQEALYRRDPHNVVRLILGKTSPADTQADSRYTRARRDFFSLLKSGVLEFTKKEALYYYKQYFKDYLGRDQMRTGFICRVKIDDGSGADRIKPHEKTLDAPKEDRFKLFVACKAMFSQVFSVFGDESGEADRALDAGGGETYADFTLEDGIRHTLINVSSPGVVSRVREILASKSLFIADGHHRFETAKRYRDFMIGGNKNHTGNEAYNYVTMYLSNIYQKGLIIAPINRLIYGLSAFSSDYFFEKLSRGFITEDVSGKTPHELLNILRGEKGDIPVFALVMKERKLLIRPKKETYSDYLKNSGLSAAVAPLDVAFLHRVVFDDLLGISPEMVMRKEHVDYEHDIVRFGNQMQSGKYQAGILLRSTRVEDVMRVADAGEKMPQKSTFFYPKILSGLVINPLTDDERFFENPA